MKSYVIRSGVGGLLVCLFLGCIADYSTPMQFQESGRLVVEGYITGNDSLDFRLGRTVALAADSAFRPERGALVTILCKGGASYGPGREVEPGLYRIGMGALDREAEYGLEFTTGGETYRSDFRRPSYTPPIDSLHWEKPASGAPVEISISTHDETGQAVFYWWTFEEDWEFTANYFTHWFLEPETETFYYRELDSAYFCWNKDRAGKVLIATTGKLAENRIVNHPLHTLACTDIKLSYLYAISVSQRGLSREGYDYLLNKQKMNEGMGGLFAPQPSELKGNIQCVSRPDIPVVGFIEVGMVSRTRFFIDGQDVYEYPPARKCTEYSEEIGSDIGYGDLYRRGYRPFILPEGGLIPKFWVESRCLDCTHTGTKNKPAFWPNDDL